MKSLWRLTLLSIVGPTFAAFGQDAKPSSMRGVNRSAPPPSATLVVGINASVGTIAEPGWPLIVTATTSNTPPVPSIPSDLRLRMTNETGGAVALNFQPITPPPSSTAEPARYWVAAESDTSRLAPGRYRIALESGASGWRLETGEIQILPASPERAGLLPLLKIQRFLLQGRDDDALAEAGRELSANPNHVQAWIAKGDILMKKDDPDNALAAYTRAQELHGQRGSESFPILRRQKAAHTRSLEKRGVLEPK
jgi:hypothetical protein